jgi:hypothetical protein
MVETPIPMTQPKVARRRRRLRIGDVLEIDTSRGRAYAQITHTGIEFYGTLIRVLPGFFLKRPDPLGTVVSEKERYFTFFEAGPAVWRGDVTIVGNEPIPAWARKFPLLRHGWRGHWSLFDGKRYSRVVKTLTDEQKKLSLMGQWNYSMLIEQLQDDWDPTDEV